jgi:hypothetical protein
MVQADDLCPPQAVGSGGVNRVLDRLPGMGGKALLAALQVIQQFDEHQVGDLVDYLKRVGDATRPECVPDPVDLVRR